MNSKLYIPKTISVGFQQRSDTFTGKLGYIIYTDHKGVLRKEASWNSWRDKKIDTVTVDNTPQPGFTLNKGIKRDGYWGSGRSVIRVWDPRDFEFEISVDNLIGILMHADVSKRDITEPCVFAWNGTELILLPTNSIEYQESVAHTDKIERKFSARDLVVGHTYAVRREEKSVVYLGSHPRYEVVKYSSCDRYGFPEKITLDKKPKKGHVFIDPTPDSYGHNEVYVKDPAAFISHVEIEEVHQEFASLVDKYYTRAESQPLAGLCISESTNQHCHSGWFALNETDFVELDVNTSSWGDDLHRVTFSRFARYDVENNAILLSHEGYNVGRNYWHGNSVTPHRIPGLDQTMPAVVQQIAELQTAILAALANWDKRDQNTWSEHYKRIKAAITSAKMGDLQLILADGKRSIDHNL